MWSKKLLALPPKTYRQFLLELIGALKEYGPSGNTTFTLDVADENGLLWEGEEFDVTGLPEDVLAKVLDGLECSTSTNLRADMVKKKKSRELAGHVEGEVEEDAGK